MSLSWVRTAGSFVLAASCALSVAAEPTPEPKELIVGRWQGVVKGPIIKADDPKKDKAYFRKAEVRFHKDGSFQYKTDDIPELKKDHPTLAKGATFTGKYSFVSKTEIEMVVKVEGKEVKARGKVMVTKDELILTPAEKGRNSEKYKRVKK